MTATVTPLRLCSCGQPGAPLTIVDSDAYRDVPALSPIRHEADEIGEVLHAYICDECLAKTEARLASVRPVFNAMMECAVPKHIADEAMGYLLELLDEDEEGGNEIEDPPAAS